MQTIGIFLRDLSCSELNCTIFKQINKMAEDNIINPVIFVEDVNHIFIQPKCLVLQAYELYGFKEPVISTTLSSAQKLIKIPTIKKKLFYIWDFEWLRFSKPNNELMNSVYGSSKLDIINRTEERANVYEKIWNIPCYLYSVEFYLSGPDSCKPGVPAS